MGNDDTALASKRRELNELERQVRQLETEIAEQEAAGHWQARSFYTAYYATTGFMLGIFGAATSLLLNVIGAPIAGKNPLELIRIYLTFPLGEKALLLTDQAEQVYAIGDGVILAIGCCLYLGTGMLLGVPFQIVMGALARQARLQTRMLLATVLALALWLINFYGILSWLQPLLIGDNWIVDTTFFPLFDSNDLLPWWVAAATHLVFGWTMALLYPLGRYIPYYRPTEK